MPILSQKEVRNFKLSSIPLPKLKKFSESIGQKVSGNMTHVVKKLMDFLTWKELLSTLITN